MWRYILGAILVFGILAAKAPEQASAFGGTPCKKECEQKCDDDKKSCDKKAKVYCKVAKFAAPGAGVALCEEYKQGCKHGNGYCKAVGCMDAPQKCGGGGWGEPHLLSLDRLYFDFQAVGEFILAKSEERGIEIQMRTGPTRSPAFSQINAVAVGFGDNRITFQRGRDDFVHINGEPVDVPEARVETDPETGIEQVTGLIETGDSVLAYANGEYVLILPDGTTVQLRRPFHLNVNVLPGNGDALYEGLLGDGNGDILNDIATRGGQTLPIGNLDKPRLADDALYQTFGNSWRISDTESLFDYAPGESTATFTDLSYPRERGSVPAEDLDARRAEAETACQAAGLSEGLLYETCVFDILATGETVYAQGYELRAEAAIRPAAYMAASGVRLGVYEADGETAGGDTVDAPQGGLPASVLGTGFAQPGVVLDIASEAETGASLPLTWRDDQMRGVWIDVVGEDHERPSAMSTGEGRAYISRPAMNEDGSLNEDRVSMPKTPGIYAVRLVKSKSPREILAMRYVVVREPASDETGNTDE